MRNGSCPVAMVVVNGQQSGSNVDEGGLQKQEWVHPQLGGVVCVGKRQQQQEALVVVVYQMQMSQMQSMMAAVHHQMLL